MQTRRPLHAWLSELRRQNALRLRHTLSDRVKGAMQGWLLWWLWLFAKLFVWFL